MIHRCHRHHLPSDQAPPRWPSLKNARVGQRLRLRDVERGKEVGFAAHAAGYLVYHRFSPDVREDGARRLADRIPCRPSAPSDLREEWSRPSCPCGEVPCQRRIANPGGPTTQGMGRNEGPPDVCVSLSPRGKSHSLSLLTRTQAGRSSPSSIRARRSRRLPSGMSGPGRNLHESTMRRRRLSVAADRSGLAARVRRSDASGEILLYDRGPPGDSGPTRRGHLRREITATWRTAAPCRPMAGSWRLMPGTSWASRPRRRLSGDTINVWDVQTGSESGHPAQLHGPALEPRRSESGDDRPGADDGGRQPVWGRSIPEP